MHLHQSNQVSDVIMLPVLLLVALAAWTVSFLAGDSDSSATRRPPQP